MKLPLRIATKYLFSRKLSLVNIISFISVFGVAGMSAALIVILSVFNGFDSLIQSMINQFDPDLKITAKTGKTFLLDSVTVEKISKIPEIKAVAGCIEETVLFRYRDYQYIGVLKGVSQSYDRICGIQNCIYIGDYLLEDSLLQTPFAVMGCDIAGRLGLNMNGLLPLKIYAPKRSGKVSVLNPSEAFKEAGITVSGVFHIHQDFDSKYVIVPIDFARNALEYSENEFSSLEVSCVNVNKAAKELEKILGENFDVKDRYRQQDMLYKIMQSEKLSIIVMLSFIIVIASFNIIGALTMLIIDKKNDIATLSSLGANEVFLKNVFSKTGQLITVTGAVAGLVLGLIICWLQTEFHLLTFPADGSFIIDYYPVEIRFWDIVTTFLVVTAIGFLMSAVPSKRVKGK